MSITNISVLILNFLILFSVLVVFRIVRKIHDYRIESILQKQTNNLFVQVESLLGLYKDLNFSKSLPKTRGWAGSPDFLLLLTRIVQQNKPLVVMECSSGVSSVVLAQCLKLNSQGHVYSLEHESVFAEQTRAELDRHGLKDWATILDAPLVKHQINGQKWLWYSLDNLQDNLTLDMIVVDGPPASIGRSLSAYNVWTLALE